MIWNPFKMLLKYLVPTIAHIYLNSTTLYTECKSTPTMNLKSQEFKCLANPDLEFPMVEHSQLDLTSLVI